ncbi:amidohydrolase family protein [Nonomuraea sp. NPDC050394]|uniref:metal-dependent hydrolase family protein n=1 Tax=Nonomuraea sp. NPDC050394 TaxID=3364363 RepID=UPI0037A839E0
MHRVVFRGGSVFDGTGTAVRRADVAIADGRFVAVGPDLTGDEIVHVPGLTLLPGLFNCHVHVVGCLPDPTARLKTPFSLQFYQALPILDHLLASGITSARDCAGADLGVKKALEDGLIGGPRLQISINAISQTGGHIDGWTPSGECVSEYYVPHPGRPHPVADGPDELRALVRTLVRAGAEVIKICTTDGGVWPREEYLTPHFRDDELAVIMAEARAARVPVMSHACGAEGVKSAVRAEVRSIEHGTYLDREAVELMAERGTWLVPTLVRFHGMLDRPEVAARIPQAMIDDARRVADASAASFALALEAGVRIAMGTDMHGGEFLDELGYMHKFGMRPQAVLEASTRSAAQLMGWDDDLGTIEPGKRADLVLVDGDPFDFWALKGAIKAVYQDGVRVSGS